MNSNDVVCIGSAAIDSVFLLKEFPSPDQISLAHWRKEFFGGSSADVAVGLSRLGLYTGLISKVGRDPQGVTLLNTLVSEGVDIRAVRISGKTAQTVVLLNEKGEKTIITDTGCVLKTGDEVPHAYLSDAQAVYIGDCFLPVAERAVDIAKKMGVMSFFRLKNVHLSSRLNIEKVISNADFVIMNERTYSLIDKQNENFIITKGRNGCYYVKEGTTIQGFPVESVDTTGAGDAFCAGFIYKIVKGYSIEDALHFGNAAGAVSTTTYGAMESMPSKGAVESLLRV